MSIEDDEYDKLREQMSQQNEELTEVIDILSVHLEKAARESYDTKVDPRTFSFGLFLLGTGAFYREGALDDAIDHCDDIARHVVEMNSAISRKTPKADEVTH